MWSGGYGGTGGTGLDKGWGKGRGWGGKGGREEEEEGGCVETWKKIGLLCLD